MQPVLVLHGHGLRAACLLVDLDAAEAGQEVGDLAMDRWLRLSLVAICTVSRSLRQAASIARVGHGAHEIAAEADERRARCRR